MWPYNDIPTTITHTSLLQLTSYYDIKKKNSYNIVLRDVAFAEMRWIVFTFCIISDLNHNIGDNIIRSMTLYGLPNSYRLG